MAFNLRPYQSRTIDDLWAWFGGNTGNPLLVLPTGAGKSIIAAQIVSDAISFAYERPIRVLVVTHQKELIEQNYEKFTSLRPDVQTGIYSAGIGRKDCNSQVLFAGVQSIYNKTDIGGFDLVVVDECHTIPKSGDGRYKQLFERLQADRPHCRVIGLTATPFRLGSGFLHKGENALFSGIASEVTIIELLELGFLSPVVTYKPAFTVSMDGVKKTAGEYNAKQATARMMENNHTERALNDVIEKGSSRRSWLLFCMSIEHAEQCGRYLQSKGILCAIITGKTPKKERESILQGFKSGYIQAVANVGVLTTGFDAPNIDLVVMLRPTESTALYLQMVGRGLRIADGKADCLLLDYAGNIEKHGCIDDPIITEPRQSRGGGASLAPVKYCPKCEFALHTSVMRCKNCGFEYPASERERIDYIASQRAVISKYREPIFTEHQITGVSYSRHPGKNGKPDSVKVTYFGNQGATESNWFAGVFAGQVATEYLCFEHKGYAAKKARDWWRKWVGDSHQEPETVTEALQVLDQGISRKPTGLMTEDSGKHPKIVALR
ncbi:DEAD/DEAH box helicase [Photobacterium damselae]|uniref:DEAD/DEAH box helicase n=1 Tax=Photobacterium damselae TaxID=38293 RepID=UPI001F2B6746|nr:DEAD/DEAH box helicase family protein [Photobacterium damselae]UKA12950.1 DEAD/DEAH box helicase family protein [Photobacterium damselae subsp. damselae]